MCFGSAFVGWCNTKVDQSYVETNDDKKKKKKKKKRHSYIHRPTRIYPRITLLRSLRVFSQAFRCEINTTMTETKKCNEWTVLSLKELEEKVASMLPAWTIVNNGGMPQLVRNFVTKDFQSGLDFIAAAGAIAERLNHHPDLSISGYRNVSIVIYTHSLSGCTDLDIELARTIDAEVKIVYSPKYLKENPIAAATAAS